MAITIKKKQNEPTNSFLYRFGKAVKQSGFLNQVKNNRFYSSGVNRNRRRISAIYKAKTKSQIDSLKRAGLLKGSEGGKFIKKALRNPKKMKID